MTKKTEEQFRTAFNSAQKVHRFVSNDLTLRMAAVDTTEIVNHMQKLQKTFPLATIGLGRSMTGALLMASHLGEGQQVGLLFKGAGPLKSLYAEAHFEGQVRAYTPEPQYFDPNLGTGLSVGKALGIGLLSVSRHLPFQRAPHHGTVELKTGEIGEDIAHYLEQSHQIRSLISLGVHLNSDGSVAAAGGILIEVMPGIDENIVEKLQTNYETKKPHVTDLLRAGCLAVDLMAPFMEGIEYKEINHDHTISYWCPCDEDRVMRALETLGTEELEQMARDSEAAEITCQVCGKPYSIAPESLKELSSRVAPTH